MCSCVYARTVFDVAANVLASLGCVIPCVCVAHAETGVSDCSPTQAKLVGNLLTHYPERLGFLVMLDPPFVFDMVWSAMKPLMPDETLAKMKMLSKPAHLKQHADVFGPELFEWLMAEVKENRESKIAKNKAYWEWRDEKGNVKPHDPRGTASFVASKYYTLPVDPKYCKVRAPLLVLHVLSCLSSFCGAC